MSVADLRDTGDSISLDVLRHRLEGIAGEMQATLLKSAFSAIVKEGMDASACLLTTAGEMLAQSEAIPLHLGALVPAVAGILAEYPAREMQPGDLYLANDPYAGGTHLPDFTLLAPAIVDGEVIALAAAMMHHQDVGGMRAGSVPPDATEIFQEGLRLPPVQLARGGVYDDGLYRVLLANTRTPDAMRGDLAAQHAAVVAAAARVVELVPAEGPALLWRQFGQLLDRTERMVRASIARVPDGHYAATDSLDDDGVKVGEPVPVAVGITVCGDTLNVDFSGSAAQVSGAVNSVASGALAATYFVVLGLTPSTVAANGGVMRPVTLTLPHGSVVNASVPAAVNGRMATVKICTAVLLDAMANAFPDRLPAANAGMSAVLVFGGRWPDGRVFVSSEIVAGGSGARPDADGVDGISTDIGNAMNMPAEALEFAAPMRLVSSHVRADSGGQGRFRGGLGVRRAYMALADDISVTHRSGRFSSAPAGLAGGEAGAISAAEIWRKDGTKERLSSKFAALLQAGDQLIVDTCGGSGHGSPAARATLARARDLLDGKVTVRE